MDRLIKIYHKNGKYGFSEPCEFDSVQQLVDHFTTNSLAEYNRQLNCTLDYPVVNQMVRICVIYIFILLLVVFVMYQIPNLYFYNHIKII